jgi:peptidylprolyl isomerase
MGKYLSIILVLALFSCQKPSSEKENEVTETQSTTVQVPAVDKEFTTPTGLKYIDEVIGTGRSPQTGDQVKVHYTGTLEDGTKFDSSRDRNQPFEFPLGVGRVIKGWDEGVATMKEGGKRKLIIPSELAYGSKNMGSIPPNSILFFDVELIEVVEKFVDTDFSLPGREEVTKSGLRMIIHKEGNGEIPLPGQTVKVHYTGLLENGSKFDSSHDRGQPFSFQLGQGRVIKGWDEALALMSKGEKRTLIIPPEIGYGNRRKNKIPPNSTLIFEVELIDFQ